MTKRLAIQFFGHLRTFEYTFKSFKKHVLDVNEKDGWKIDIFFHTWDTTDHSNKIGHHNSTGEKRGIKVSDKLKQKILNMYKPKKYIIEPQEKLNEQDYNYITNVVHWDPNDCDYANVIKNSSKTRYVANQLRVEYEKENNIQYDMVLQLRFDVFFNNDLNIDFIKSHLLSYYPENNNPAENRFTEEELDYVIAQTFSMRPVYDIHHMNACDIMFLGKPNAMNLTTNGYLTVFKTHHMCAEKDFCTHMHNQGIKNVMLDFTIPKDWYILRPWDVVSVQNKKIPFAKKIKKELYKLLPYFLVHKKIEKYKQKGY